MMLLLLKSKAFFCCPIQKHVFKFLSKMKVAFFTKCLKSLAEHDSLTSRLQT